MSLFVAWYTTGTEAEAHVFDTEAEARAWSEQMFNTWRGWAAGEVFKAPARWTRRGAIDNALKRAMRARGK